MAEQQINLNAQGQNATGNGNTSNAKNTAHGYTTIRIIPGQDGQSYTLEILEAEAKNGNRIDQRVATKILAMDQQFRDPNFISTLQQMRQNPQGMLQSLMQRMMGGGMPPMMGGFNPMMGGGFMGR